MISNIYILLFSFLLQVLFLQGVLPEKSIITVYKGIKFTWNEARCFCERGGGRLLAFETENKFQQKFSSLKTFIMDSNYWIGLYDHKSDDCSNFQWHNTDISAVFFNWGWTEPDHCNRDKCIRVTKNGKWLTKQCDTKLPIICENTESSCDFEEKPRTDIRLNRVPPDASMLFLAGDLTLCKVICQNSTLSNLQCRGIQVNATSNPNHCYLFFIESPTFLDDTDNLQTGYGSLYLQRCYESKEVVLQDGDVEIIPNTDTDPIDSCPEITTEQTSYSSMFTTNIIDYDSTSVVKTTSTSSQTTSEFETTESLPKETTNVATQDISRSTRTTESHLDSVLATLISETKVEKKSTSASLRSRISVMETRTSATSMGLTASIIMSSILAAIIISDIPLLVNHIRFFWCR